MSVNISLIDRSGQVPESSGLNWGFANAHVCNNDAYLKIIKEDVINNPSYFPPKLHRDIINVVWDDGTTMVCMLEGTQVINGDEFPKQISSYGDKSRIGTYLRGRIGVFNRRVNRTDLDNYGRTHITVSYLGGNDYRFDFS